MSVQENETQPDKAQQTASTVNATTDTNTVVKTTALTAVMNRTVFFSASSIILAITLFGLFFPAQAAKSFNALLAQITSLGGWFYIAAVAVLLITALYCAFSRFSNIKLGPDHASPDYSNLTWFAMLFSAGMGIGLMFYGVAEPVKHLLNPPVGKPETVAAAREAMNITFFHWGLHAWAIFAIVALILAVYSFRHGLPLTLRSALYPFIGERIYGRIGDVVDVFAIVSTLFGVATSLGLGVSQINAGLHHLFPSIPDNHSVQMVLIVAITLLATASVVSGLDKGIKLLSELNLGAAALLMLFILITGSTVYLFQAFVQNVGEYLSGIVQKTFNLYAYRQTDWIGGWTVFYWGWWISWAPFVGMFIARVSRGRTIREFIIGVLFVPTGFTAIWMTVFGNSAIDMILHQGFSELGSTVSSNVSIALFAFLEQFPLSGFTSILAIIMIVLFFVTSSDSGALVIDTLASNGAENTPTWSRVYWACLCGVVAMVLLFAGGLSALQTMAIAAALPFTIVLLIATWGLLKTLDIDAKKQEARQFVAYLPQAYAGSDWRKRLQNLMDFPNKARAIRFLDEQAKPAIHAVFVELQKQTDLRCEIDEDAEHIRLRVMHGEEIDFEYGVYLSAHDAPTFESREQYYRAEVHLGEGGQDYDIMGWSEDAVINDILAQYQKHMHFLHNLRS